MAGVQVGSATVALAVSRDASGGAESVPGFMGQLQFYGQC